MQRGTSCCAGSGSRTFLACVFYVVFSSKRGSFFFSSFVSFDLTSTKKLQTSPQTVPTCNELYRASYVYYTTPEIPPDLRACCEFIARALSGSRGGGNVVGGLGSDVGGLPSSFHDPSLPEVPGPAGRILIHDMTGTTRAPLVAASWLVAAHGASPQAALSAAAARHPGVAPTAADVEELSRFARELAANPAVRGGFVRVGQRQQQMHAEHVALMQAQLQAQRQQQQQQGGGGGGGFFQQ